MLFRLRLDSSFLSSFRVDLISLILTRTAYFNHKVKVRHLFTTLCKSLHSFSSVCDKMGTFQINVWLYKLTVASLIACILPPKRFCLFPILFYYKNRLNKCFILSCRKTNKYTMLILSNNDIRQNQCQTIEINAKKPNWCFRYKWLQRKVWKLLGIFKSRLSWKILSEKVKHTTVA